MRATTHEETRQKLLKTARKLVLKKGVRALSLREVARAAGFSPASLYEYFDGRGAIVEALARESASALRAALDRAMAKGDKATDKLINLGAGYVRWAKENPEDFFLLFDRVPSKRRTLEEDVPMSSPYRLVLDAVQACRPSTRERSEQLAYGLWASVHGMAMLQLTHLAGFDADFESADRAMLSSLIRGWK